MGSRREEERNEKIIRGLMKLPPNRRCINCNSLGPQYVCTNFWTFVCMTCSGIHREFTHRVKSVSMSKFTSQEVEALQNGGNQRAREMFLKDWDLQSKRLPDNSNVNKVREFIKNVYVDRRYTGGKTSDKPPKDTQAGLGSHLDETRRASSYHSYSQSPPYDNQYEERRYGKHTAVLTRKPGSDRGPYIGKVASLVYSPTRMSEQMFEDRFANESSISRISDYSVSSGGDPSRSGAHSPNFEKDVGSPPVHPSRDMSSLKANIKRDIDGIPHPKRSASLGSMGSVGSNSVSGKSFSSGHLTDVVSEHERPGAPRLEKMSSLPQSYDPVNYGGLDLFETPVVSEPIPSAAPQIDLFQLPEISAAHVNLFQGPQESSAPSNIYQPASSSPAILNLFQNSEQPSTTTLDRSLQVSSIPKNEGWATFDTLPPVASTPGIESLSAATMLSNEGSSLNFDQFPSSDTSMQWPSFQNYGASGPFPSSDPWPSNFHDVQAPTIATSTQVSSPLSDAWPGDLHSGQASVIGTSTQSWNAFDASISHLPFEGSKQSNEPQTDYTPSSTPDQCSTRVYQETNDGNLSVTSYNGLPGLAELSLADTGPLYTPSVLPLMTEATEHKSTNPFDFPCDSDFEQSSLFLEMSSLQAALPNAELPSPFLGGGTQSWFPQHPMTPFVPAAAQGGLAYMSGQAPVPQIPNVPAQEPVASFGGNPFA